MTNYQTIYDNFSIKNLEDIVGVAWGQPFNAADVLIHRHRQDKKPAVRYHGKLGDSTWTFSDLSHAGGHLAGQLQRKGLRSGDVVAVFLPRIPELALVATALWHLGAAYLPLFTAFGPESIAYRIQGSQAKLIVTDAAHRDVIAQVAGEVPVMTVDTSTHPQDWILSELLAQQGEEIPAVRLDPDMPFLYLFTSGTTGHPKAVPVPLKALYAFSGYMLWAVGMQKEDSYWNVADPGWAYGLYYGVVGSWLMGQTLHLTDLPFSPQMFRDILERFHITNLAAAPTAYRMLMHAPGEVWEGADISLQRASSAGEPLNPEAIRWFLDKFGVLVHDHYGQTELGMIINNHNALQQDVQPGAMGKPMPGFEAVLLSEDGRIIEQADRCGQ
ncbi:MAG: AMP-binding protein, partial [Firmicutes bacterium]|nr:AMP-binding protein [Bacillota bacterium]